jgi:hypothetical protein
MGWCVPVITAGSAGGTVKTGSYIDYRDMSFVNTDQNNAPDAKGGFNPGLIWNQFLGTVLQAMGLPRSEFEIPAYQPMRPDGVGTGGYGYWQYDPQGFQQPGYYQSAYSSLGDWLPYLKA